MTPDQKLTQRGSASVQDIGHKRHIPEASAAVFIFTWLCSFYIVKKLPPPAHQWVKWVHQHAPLSSVHASLLRTELKSEQHEHIAGVRERPGGWVDATMRGGGAPVSVILRVIGLARRAFDLKFECAALSAVTDQDPGNIC